MTLGDPDKQATYRAEERLHRWIEAANPSVRIDATSHTPEPEARFVAPADVQRYVDRVLAHLRDNVKDYGGAEHEPVRVRPRRGHLRAEYSLGVMSIPPFEVGGSWALRELVVLHELTHHLARWDAHGSAFRATFIRLLEDIGKPVWAELLHLAFVSENLEVVGHEVADDTIARVAKVLRQAESASNEHEREAFMAKAQSLATRHSIALAVARAHTAKAERRDEPTEQTVTIGEPGKRGLARYVRLLLAVATANDLKALISSDSSRVFLIGFESDIDLTKALYESLLIQMVADCTTHLRTDDEYAHVSTITRRLAFYEGYAARIGQRLMQARETTRAAVVEDVAPDLSTETALALKAKEIEVSDFYKDLLRKQNIRGSWRGNRTPSWHRAPGAYEAGTEAASRARLGAERALGA